MLVQLSLFASEKSQLINFDLKGKTQEKQGVFTFTVKEDPVFSVLILPGEPRALCARLSEEGAAQMKDLEGLAMMRWHIQGQCEFNEQTSKHVIKHITKMKPLGDGVIKDEDGVVEGRLEVKGNPNSENYLRESMMLVHREDGVSFRIPAKKFKSKPSGLSYQEAAKLDQAIIVMKSRVQYYREAPHRIATVYEFELAE